MAVICDSAGAAWCSQPSPADPRVPTPIQPTLTRSLAPSTLWGARGAIAAATAEVLRKFRRVLSRASLDIMFSVHIDVIAVVFRRQQMPRGRVRDMKVRDIGFGFFCGAFLSVYIR